MAGASITIDLSGLAAMDGQLQAMFARASDLSPLMEAIGEANVTQTRDRFESESAPDGSAWEPSQRVLKFGGKTLTLDGFLSDSITYRAGSDQVEIGSNLVYARPHQLGWAEGGIPQREYLGVSRDGEDEIVELAADYLLGELAA